MTDERTYLSLKELWEFADSRPQARITGIDTSRPPHTKRTMFTLREDGIHQWEERTADRWNYLDLFPRKDRVSGSDLADYLLPFYREDALVVIKGRLFVMIPTDVPSTYGPLTNEKLFKTTSLCPVKPSNDVLSLLNDNSDVEFRSAVEDRIPDGVGIDLQFFAFGTRWYKKKTIFRDYPLLYNTNWQRLLETETVQFGPRRIIKLSRFRVTEANLFREFGDPIDRLLRIARK